MCVHGVRLGLLAIVCFAASPLRAGLIGGKREGKPVALDVRHSDPAGLTKAEKLDALKSVRAVVIPQFTVEFVDRSTGLAMRQRGGAVAINYTVGVLDDSAAQALVDTLYGRWAAGLRAQGLTVVGSGDAARLAACNKGIAALAKPASAAIDTPIGRNRLFAADGGSHYFLDGERQAAQSGAAKTASGLAEMMPFGGVAKRLMGMGKSLRAGSAMVGEMKLGQEANTAVMHVRLVIGIRETDRPGPLFTALRSGSDFIAEPRFVVEAGGSSVDVTNYAGTGGRDSITLPADLLFAQDVLQDRPAMNDSTGATASNVAARGLFLAGAVSSSLGGASGINLKQSYNVAATPDKVAFAAAAADNLTAVQAMFLQQLAAAW